MRLRGKTSTDDWHPITLLDMMRHRECWHCDWDWKDWRFGGNYTWYDGPMWHLFIGPLWIAIAN
jgi:hypothetical protein